MVTHHAFNIRIFGGLGQQTKGNKLVFGRAEVLGELLLRVDGQLTHGAVEIGGHVHLFDAFGKRIWQFDILRCFRPQLIR